MNVVTRSWVRKAERDFKVAQGLMRRWVAGYGDATCFHCQQAVEKYLKALLMYLFSPRRGAGKIFEESAGT